MNYNKDYFNWQKTIGEFGGKANLFKFEKYIKSTDNVLDFGCGGGYLLSNIQTTGDKIGIEINPTAKDEATKKGIKTFYTLDSLKSDSVDIAISNHALEHVINPNEILQGLKRIVKNNGYIVIVVPNEFSDKVNLEDHNMHLWTWTPQNLINLFKINGIEIVEWEHICHQWMPHYQLLQKIFGWKIWHKLCKIYCKITKTGYQTKVVGKVVKM